MCVLVKGSLSRLRLLGLRHSRELEDCVVRSRDFFGVGWGGGWGVILTFTFWLSLTCLIKEPLSSLKVVVVDRFIYALLRSRADHASNVS